MKHWENDDLREVALVFLKLGTIAFGGPAAHIAMMNDEIVQKRKWVNEQTFLDLLSASNLIPGPNSTELAIHLGYKRAGWLGLILAGVCFILPAMLIVLFLAFLYSTYGMFPVASSILYGIKPVIIAIVLQALWSLLRTAVKNKATIIVGLGAVMMSLLGVNEILLLILAGGAMLLWKRRQKIHGSMRSFMPALPFVSLALPEQSTIEPASLAKLFWLFLKIGSVLYGSGYVLLAFLQTEFVDRWRILTSQQLLDAVAIGQFTPGPVFTTATFIGYLIAGTSGGILATVAIFLPAFVFVALTHRWIRRLRESEWTSALLDGVNVASLALMAVVTVRLGLAAVVDLFTLSLAAFSFFLIVRYKINTAWLVLFGGILGWIGAALT